MKPISRILPSPRQIWTRSSAIVRFILYLAGVEVFLFFLRQAFRWFKWTARAESLRPWLVSIGFICIILLLFIVARWLRKKLMWRLRNRLIVTYVFIGVIPVILLLAMALIAGELLTGQFATFLATSDLQHRLDALDTATSTLANTLAHQLKQGGNINSSAGFRASERFPQRQVTLWYRGNSVVLGASGRDRQPTPVPDAGNDVHAIVQDGDQLFLRASRSVPVGSGTLTVVSSVPLDARLLRDITAGLGEVVLTPGSVNPGDSTSERNSLRAGSVPPASNRFDAGVDFAAPISLMDWRTGKTSEGYLFVSTRPSLLFNRLFANLGSNANAILGALAIIALLLGLIELLALVVGVRLTRTMTRSVYELYDATLHINRGDFAHRIGVRGHDQMAELETSFNSMSNSLERLIVEQKEKQRMESELAIAHEVQEQLFPRDLGNLKSLEVHGVCRPARSVSGDYYDFLPLGGEKLGIAVGDISGKGISAALLMASIHSAVRVYEMGRVPVRGQLAAAGAATISLASDSVSLMPASIVQSPSAVLGLLNRHLFHSTPPEKYATMFFSLWNGPERRLTYSNAGHLPPLIVRQNGVIEELTVGGTVIGLFDDVVYEETAVKLAPGDLFVAYSDGLTEPENEFGEFGSTRLIDLLRKNRSLPLARISDIVTTSVIDWIGAAEQPDDVTLVLVRAR
jgi:sigma-B regulation protein RsbU (phosphoserine phosphatase)